MNTKSTKNLTAAQEALTAAEERLKQAQEAHVESFKRDLAELFKAYGLAIEPAGIEGARLDIVPYTPSSLGYLQ